MKKWICTLISMAKHARICLINKHQNDCNKTKTVFWGEEMVGNFAFFTNSLHISVLNKNDIIVR